MDRPQLCVSIRFRKRYKELWHLLMNIFITITFQLIWNHASDANLRISRVFIINAFEFITWCYCMWHILRLLSVCRYIYIWHLFSLSIQKIYTASTYYSKIEYGIERHRCLIALNFRCIMAFHSTTNVFNEKLSSATADFETQRCNHSSLKSNASPPRYISR